ncbi:MAG: hypothetical protein IKX38_03830 [Bacteroidales bacterium]|nr:hypothetical protein [Bacteroidales bacterium]
MKKILPVFLIVLAAIALSLTSCRKGSNAVTLTIPETGASTDANYFGIISGYTCGFISEGTPLQVQFTPGVKFKINYNEKLPKNTFTISPNVAGNAYWIDENTIGYQFTDSPKEKTKYDVKFNVDNFVSMPNESKTLDFCFMINAQDFNIVNTLYRATDNKSCSYNFDLSFVNPVNPDATLAMLDKSITDNYHVSATALSPNKVRISVNDIPRSGNSEKMKVTFDGSKMSVKKNLSTDVVIPSSNDFSIVGYNVNQSEKSIDVQFSNPLKTNQILSDFSLPNNIKYNIDIVGSSAIIYLDPQNDYDDDFNVRIESNSTIDNYGNTLKKGLTIDNIQINKLTPEVQWVEDGTIIPNTDNTTIYFKAICLNSVIVKIVRIYDNNIIHFLQDNEISSSYMYDIKRVGRLEKKFRLQLTAGNKEDWNTYGIKLADYIEVKPGDMFNITLDFDISDYAFAKEYNQKMPLTDDSEYWDNDSYSYKTYYYDDDYDWYYYSDPNSKSFYNNVDITKNFLVSNVALIAKSDNGKDVSVFARNIKTAGPVAKAEVTAYNYQLQPVGTATTDANGYCMLKCTAKPYLVTAKDQNGNEAYIKTDKSLSLSLSKFDVSGNIINNNIDGFIYSNRDLWRPGDSIVINFMLADKDNVLPENFPVIFELNDINGITRDKQINNDPVGKIYSFSTATGVTDETGLWSANIRVGNTTFSKQLRIETMKPNKLEINFKPPKVIYLSKNEPVTLSSKWLNGMAASNLSANIDVKLMPTETTFSSFPEYTFVDVTKDMYTTEVSLYNSSLDASGNRNISMSPIKDINASGFMRALFTIKVFEPSGDFSITSRSAEISPNERYVGVALPEPASRWGNYYFTNKEWKFPIVIVNETGNLCKASTTLSYKLFKLDSYWWWSSHEDLSYYTSGNYHKPVMSGDFTVSNGKYTLPIKIEDEDWGPYLLVVQDKQSGSTFAKVIYFDWEYGARSSSLSQAPSIVNLLSDKDTYKVGETVNISFAANEKAKGIVTVESASKVLQIINADNLSNNSTVSFKITEDMVPNIYVYLSLIQPYDAGNDLPLRMYGVLPLKVESPNSVLNPVIKMADNANSNQKFDITVSESSGKPMYYTLAFVDEGILGITGYRTANPYDHFYAKQALNIRTWDNYKDIIDAYTGEMLSVMAAGGDGMLFNQESLLNERFSSIAYSLGPFKLDAGKSATHSIEINDYIGALRAMVVACDDNNAYGSTQQTVKVKNPLMLIPAAPRVVSPGDKFTLPVQVLSPDNSGKDVKVSISCKNLNTTKTDANVTLSKSDEGMAEFDVTVPNVSGNAEVTVNASIGSHKATSTIKIPIRTPFTTKHEKIVQEIGPGKSYNGSVECNAIEGTSIGSVTINSLIPVDIDSRIKYLDSYPYGCLEQITSKGMAKLYLETLTNLTDDEKAKVKNDIESVISSFNSYLKSDYSLTNWKSGTYVNSWTELYATHFLVEAKNRGYNVPDDMLKGIIKHQTSIAKSWRDLYDNKGGDVIQAYRLFVLALNNSAETGAMNKLKSAENLMPLSKALLASSYALAGKTSVAKDILPTIDYSSNDMLSNYYTCYGSQYRDFAFFTLAEMLCKVDDATVRNHIDVIAKVYESDRWISTQTTAFTLFVLGKYADIKGFNNAPINAIIKINNDEKAYTTNKLSVVDNFIPEKSNTISVNNKSDGLVYATIYTKYMTPEYNYKEEGNGYQMTVKYFDKNGKALDVSSLNRNTDFKAEITVKNTYTAYPITDNALTYCVPAGWEIVNDRILNNSNDNGYNHIDVRDDRVYFFFDLGPSESMTFKVNLTTTYKGSYTVPSVTVEDMYNADIFYNIPAKNVVVK